MMNMIISFVMLSILFILSNSSGSPDNRHFPPVHACPLQSEIQAITGDACIVEELRAMPAKGPKAQRTRTGTSCTLRALKRTCGMPFQPVGQAKKDDRLAACAHVTKPLKSRFTLKYKHEMRFWAKKEEKKTRNEPI